LATSAPTLSAVSVVALGASLWVVLSVQPQVQPLVGLVLTKRMMAQNSFSLELGRAMPFSTSV
jgi:hypothetical protein